MKYTFIFDLEKNLEHTDRGKSFGWEIFYGIRYYKTDEEIIVEIGDGFRHEIFLKAEHWNRLIKVIRNNELDESGINAIIGLLRAGLREEFKDNFISAIKNGKI